MRRGQLLRGDELLDGAGKSPADQRAVEARPHQQARAGGRGEGHAHRQFRVVRTAEVRVGLGPGEIEDELAVGMGLDEGRRGGRQPRIIVQGEVDRGPAGVWAHAPRVLESRQELMAQKRHLGALQRVPGLAVQLIDAGVLAGEHVPLVR